MDILKDNKIPKFETLGIEDVPIYKVDKPSEEQINIWKLSITDICGVDPVELLNKRSTTFKKAVYLLQPRLRREMQIWYGFLRAADDIVDNYEENSETTPELDENDNVDINHPLMAMFNLYLIAKERIARGEQGIGLPVIDEYVRLEEELLGEEGHKYMLSFFYSMANDIVKKEYKNEEELFQSMYGSAAVLGLIICKMLGVEDEKAKEKAKQLAYTFQLTNHLRDLVEDTNLGRSYLNVYPHSFNEEPQEEIRDLVDRIINIQKEAVEGIEYLYEANPRFAFLTTLISNNYAFILLAIKKNPALVQEGIIKTNKKAKLFSLRKVLLLNLRSFFSNRSMEGPEIRKLFEEMFDYNRVNHRFHELIPFDDSNEL